MTVKVKQCQTLHGHSLKGVVQTTAMELSLGTWYICTKPESSSQLELQSRSGLPNIFRCVMMHTQIGGMLRNAMQVEYQLSQWTLAILLFVCWFPVKPTSDLLYSFAHKYYRQYVPKWLGFEGG